MGVLKNDVGRPSNKTVKIRFILKLIGLILVIILGFIGGYKFSGSKEGIKINKPTKEEKVSKYDDFAFVNSKNASFSKMIGDSFETIEASLSYGDIIFRVVGKEDGAYLEHDFNKKAKYITEFNVGYSDPGSDFAVLTYDGELYVLDHLKNNISFKKVNYDKKIKKLLVINEFNYLEHSSKNLYVLTETDELLKVSVNLIEGQNKWYTEYKIEGKFEERVVQIGCTDGNCYHGEIFAKDNTIKLETFNGIDYSTEYVKFNNEKVKVKYLFDSYESDTDKQRLYIVTEDGDLLTAKSGLPIGSGKISNESYEFIKLKKAKVKSANLVDISTIKITYVNGNVEEFKDSYSIYNIN